MTTDEGFAQPWLDFEAQIGARLLLHGPSVREANEQFNSFIPLLLSKLTFSPPDPSITTLDREILPGLKARIYTPPSYLPGSKPACVFYHGGGWCMGDLDGEDAQVRRFCKDSGVVIVSVDFCLAPANPYPKPLDDCVKAFYWVLENSQVLGAKEGKVVVIGTSAGGNLALSTALKVIDQGKGESLGGVMALVPCTVAREAVPEKWKGRYTSYEEHAEHTVNTTRAMDMFFDAYAGAPKDSYVSPLLHTKIKELPRVYMVVCGHDTLRDDGRLMREVLNENGVPNVYDEYEGYPHWFWAYPSEHLKDPVEKFYDNFKKGLKFVLG